MQYIGVFVCYQSLVLFECIFVHFVHQPSGTNFYPARACAARGKVISRGYTCFQGEAVKPGLDWTLDSGLDWTLDWTGLEEVWVQLLLAID